MEDGAVMHYSLHKGKPITLPESKTLADSLLGAILHQPIVQPDETAVIVISGHNIDLTSHLKATEKYFNS